MSDIRPQRREIAPSVQALLAVFHESTRLKLERAPTDSRPLYERADGSICEVDEDGWPTEYDDLDRDDAIPVKPIRVSDFEIGPFDAGGTSRLTPHDRAHGRQDRDPTRAGKDVGG
ncbi:hypothetical protein ACQP1G_18320 [Nocardia sp. CA-107356]|uniref:hypothetical protein n=1 Tax=Nocardia sp. CA-107356 TaxID=3239972 RepID=UPI003D89E0DF